MPNFAEGANRAEGLFGVDDCSECGEERILAWVYDDGEQICGACLEKKLLALDALREWAEDRLAQTKTWSVTPQRGSVEYDAKKVLSILTGEPQPIPLGGGRHG